MILNSTLNGSHVALSPHLVSFSFSLFINLRFVGSVIGLYFLNLYFQQIHPDSNFINRSDYVQLVKYIQVRSFGLGNTTVQLTGLHVHREAEKKVPLSSNISLSIFQSVIECQCDE